MSGPAPRPKGPPSRFARFLAGLTCPAEDRALILGDLDERFRAIAAESGAARARVWYWGQVVKSVPAGVRSYVDSFSLGSRGGLGADVRRSLRGLRRRPAYALGVTGTMAMGIASIATVLSIAWNVWLSPLPVPDPDRVVRVFEVEPLDQAGGEAGDRTRRRLSPPLLEDMREREWASLSAVAGVARNLFEWETEAGLRRVSAVATSPEAIPILGIAPRYGRSVADDPEAREVVLTEAFWESAFGADPRIVGATTMILNGERHAVVGVAALPQGFPGDADIVTALRWSDEQLAEGMRGARYVDVIARLEANRSVQDAAQEIDTWVSGLGERHPNHAGWGGDASILADELLAPYRDVLSLLLVSGALFLVLALSNVAGLVAARSVGSRRERAVRLALGASEGQLFRASTVDGGVIGAVAAAGALAATAGLMGPVRALVPAEIPRADLIGLDAGLAFSLAAVGILAGLAVGGLGYGLSRDTRPAIGRAALPASTGSRGRSVIVAGQVALTMLLSTGGAVVLTRMVELQRTDLGFEPTGVAVAPINLTGARYPTPGARLAFWDDLVARAEARGVGLTFGTSSPMAGVNMVWGYRADPTDEQSFAQYHIVAAGYFESLGIELFQGRVFTPGDRAETERVVVVNRRFADVNFPGENPLGREIQVMDSSRRIVGVVESVRHFGPDQDTPEEIYAPFGQDPWPHAQLLLAGDPASMNPAVAEIITLIDPQLGVPPLRHYDEYVADWFAAIRLQAIVVGILAIVGTLLATLGLYALVAYRVSARQREIGIRMALGATDRRMFGRVVGQGAVLALTGIAVGSAIWVVVAPRVSLLLETTEAAARTPVLVGLLVGLVSVLACVLPAARSVTVDPALTLRADDR